MLWITYDPEWWLWTNITWVCRYIHKALSYNVVGVANLCAHQQTVDWLCPGIGDNGNFNKIIQYIRAGSYLKVELKRIYWIFEFGFDSKFVRKYIEIRNIKIPELKNSFPFLQILSDKYIACVIFTLVRTITSHYNG